MPSTFEIFNEAKEAIKWFTFKRERIALSGEKGPIIGIRGFGGGWPKDMVKYFSENNYAGVFMNLGLQTGSIDSYVETIKKEVETFHNPVIIGFSMGGLIALRYLQTHGRDKIDTLITVGSPFNGVEVLKMIHWLGGMYSDLAPSSNLLNELKNLKIPGVRVVNVFASWDQFVGNPDNISVTGKKIVLPVVGHNNLVNKVGYIAPFLDKLLGLNNQIIWI